MCVIFSSMWLWKFNSFDTTMGMVLWHREREREREREELICGHVANGDMVCLRFSKLFAAQERGNGQYKVEVSRFIPQAKANEDKQNHLSLV